MSFINSNVIFIFQLRSSFRLGYYEKQKQFTNDYLASEKQIFPKRNFLPKIFFLLVNLFTPSFIFGLHVLPYPLLEKLC